MLEAYEVYNYQKSYKSAMEVLYAEHKASKKETIC